MRYRRVNETEFSLLLVAIKMHSFVVVTCLAVLVVLAGVQEVAAKPYRLVVYFFGGGLVFFFNVKRKKQRVLNNTFKAATCLILFIYFLILIYNNFFYEILNSNCKI